MKKLTKIFFILFLSGCAHTAGDTYVLNEETIEEGFKTGRLIMDDMQSNPDYVVGATPEFEETSSSKTTSDADDSDMKRKPGRQY